ncbi:MAG: YraN family protein [Stackebrandtia sp.]
MSGRRHHLLLGAHGERLAAAHLRRDGMRVLARNWRNPQGELDIVAADRGVTVFCEVKTRRSLRFGTPMEAIDEAKATQVRRVAAGWWRTRRGRGRSQRFDAVGVIVRADGTASIDHRRGVL